MDEYNELKHIGTITSGRYPKGSGETPHQRARNFLEYVDGLKKDGLSPTEIARGCGMTTNEVRQRTSLYNSELKAENYAFAKQLSEQGVSAVEIGKRLGDKMGKPAINESSIRSLLNEDSFARSQEARFTADMLKSELKEKGLLDVGVNTELSMGMGISRTKLLTAIVLLQDEGYEMRPIKVAQLGVGGNKKTTVLVLSPPGVSYQDLYKRQSEIGLVGKHELKEDGKGYYDREFPSSLSSDRIKIKFKEDGGADKDGVIELRRGVDELSLGESKYAQVRIMVDGTHYLKGMAMYSDDLPKGVDVLFNTNKKTGTSLTDVLKPLKTVSEKDLTIDPNNPFGAQIKDGGQRHYIDKNGKDKLSPVNKINEEGDWDTWAKTLSSQMLSKQPVSLAKQQLGIAYDRKKEEFDDIMSLTNPAVKRKLLAAYADGLDSATVHLRGAAMPRQASQVLLPVTNMKDNEVYAPNFNHGESVVLIRFPHGGKFEIPELTVNNNHPTAKMLIGTAKDAIGISPKVAERLSGADFDGDSVLVIPNKGGKTIQTKSALKGLNGFDPKALYPGYEGMPEMTSKTKGLQMGMASNLITDMTIRGANDEELCRAVKHSMVVIDAQKHNLNYKLSFEMNGIAALKKSYQTSTGGASTLISRAGSDQRVNSRKEKTVYKTIIDENGNQKKILNMTPKEIVDHNNGKRVWEYTNDAYFKPLTTTTKVVDPITGKVSKVISKVEKKVADMDAKELESYKSGKKVYALSDTPTYKTIKSKKMTEEEDAFNLSSGTKMEEAYATHANKLKALGNTARKELLSTPPPSYSPSANKVYIKEVSSLNSKLNIALKNAPLERQATILANAHVAAKQLDNPHMEGDELKKIKNQALAGARVRVGADKERVIITPKEWEAIQAGAVTNNTLLKILSNTDLDKIKQLAMPRLDTRTGLSSAKETRIKSMLASGETQKAIAEALGVSLDQVKDLI
jgi:hypothetical protein